MASYLSRCLLSCAACLGELQRGGRKKRKGGRASEGEENDKREEEERRSWHPHPEVESAKLKFIVGSKFRCRWWFMSESHLNFVALLQEQKAMLCIQAVVYSMYVRPPSIDPSNDSPAYNQASCQSSTSQSCFFSLATTHVKKKKNNTYQNLLWLQRKRHVVALSLSLSHSVAKLHCGKCRQQSLKRNFKKGDISAAVWTFFDHLFLNCP